MGAHVGGRGGALILDHNIGLLENKKIFKWHMPISDSLTLAVL